MNTIKSWEKQETESLTDYKRLVKFLDFSGTLQELATQEKLAISTIKRTSSKYQWHKRKADYIASKQAILEQIKEESLIAATQEKLAAMVNSFEKICGAVANRLKDLAEHPDDIIQALPPDKLLQGISAIGTALNKIADYKERMHNLEQANKDKEPQVFKLISEPITEQKELKNE